MADACAADARPTSKIEAALERMETFTRRHDTCITATIVVCLAIVASLVLSAHIVSHSKLVFQDNWEMPAGNMQHNLTKYPARMSKRALAIMEANCAGQSATFGPQILIDGVPWDVVHVFMCEMKLHLTSPRAVVVGTQDVTCEDEHQGTYKLKSRKYPLTVQTQNEKQFTIVSAEEACAIWNALELIQGIW